MQQPMTPHPAARTAAHSSLAKLGSCIALAGLLAAMATPSWAQALEQDGRPAKAHKRQGGRIKLAQTRSSSEESAAERDRRLYRECQGRPNSGACSGYAYKPPGRQR